MTHQTLQSLALPGTSGAANNPKEAESPQYLTFYLGEEIFGVGILAICEIIEYHALTEVPLVPPLIRGVINLRGSVVPVVDLAVRFGRTPKPLSKRTCIVIVETSDSPADQETTTRHKMGVVVDGVSEVLEILPQAIESPPEFGTHLRADFVKGMAKINDRFVVLIDIDSILSLQEISVRSVLELE